MTDEQPPLDRGSIEAALPTMKERARDHIHLMFLVDDFQRAIRLHNVLAETVTALVTEKAAEHLPPEAALKLTTELMMMSEMARNVTIRGDALIEQVEKVVGKIPPWDQP